MINLFNTEFSETKGVLIAICKAPTMTYKLLALMFSCVRQLNLVMWRQVR